METYIVRVNGTEFEVEVEKVGSDTAPTFAAAPAAAPKPAAKPAGRETP
jgi:hypothetical protein